MGNLIKKFHKNEPEVLLQEQTVVLRFSVHCKEGCLREVKKFITKRKGVTSVNIEEMNETNALATVQGNFDVQKLVDSLWKEKSKRVDIVSPSSDNQDTDDNVPPVGDDIHDNDSDGGSDNDNDNESDEEIKNIRD
ncbi:hypothetical protein QYF36_013649 [Acer negundo]|nr:hypothetical protein QYF36_013649 [Acer negundo]